MDRTLWARFGAAALKTPHAIQWLSDNGAEYTAPATVLYVHEFGLVPITTPAYSQRVMAWPKRSSGRSSVTTWTAPNCGMPKPCWPRLADVSDYNTQAPHSALGMRSPHDYHAVMRRTAG